jgi:hypothetical protein
MKMMLLAFAALLQAAQPAPSTPDAPVPAWRAAGHAWGQCVKARIDARLQSADAPAALADAAIAGCTRELEAVRRAIAAERGDAEAAANVERVRTGGRATFLAYIAQARGQRPAGGAASTPAH